MGLPAPARGDCALAQAERAADALERLRQRDVLHQRDFGKAAGGVECLALDEHRLVAGRDAGSARAQVHHGRRRASASGAGLRSSRRSGPNACFERASPSSTSRSASGGSRVSAWRNSSTSPLALRGAGIHLHGAPARRRDDMVGAHPGALHGGVAAAAVDDDDLDAERAQFVECIERAGDALRLRRAPA